MSHVDLVAGQRIYRSTVYSASNDVLGIGTRNWDLGGFKTNPILLIEHDADRPTGQFISLSWHENALVGEFFFNPNSPHTEAAEMEWNQGLRSSLSVGIVAKYSKKFDDVKFLLREISQVSVPKDPLASATEDERSVFRIESAENLKNLKASLREVDSQQKTFYLCASAASPAERTPNRTIHRKTSMEQQNQTQEDSGMARQMTDSIASLKTKSDELHRQVLELTESNKALESKIDALESAADSNAAESAAESAADSNAADLREVALFDAYEYKEFLPEDFEVRDQSELVVLQAAMPPGIDSEGMSAEAMRKILNADRQRRKRVSNNPNPSPTAREPYTGPSVSATTFI